FVTLIIEPPAGMVRGCRGLLQDGVRGDHLARDQVAADAEMLERALGLRAPQLVGRHLDHAEAVALFSHAGHWFSPSFLSLPLAMIELSTLRAGGRRQDAAIRCVTLGAPPTWKRLTCCCSSRSA